MSYNSSLSFEAMCDEVTEMLQYIFNPEAVPELDLNTETVSLLHSVLTQVITQRIGKEKLILHYQNLTKLYSSKAKQMKENLKNMGLSYEDLPSHSVTSIHALASASVILDLEQPSDTNFLLGLNKLQREEIDLAKERINVTKTQRELTKKCTNDKNKKIALEREVELAEENLKSRHGESEKRINQTNFMQCKIKEYQKRVDELEEKLKLSGFEDELSHSVLVEKAQEIKRHEESIKVMDVKLTSYRDLPPNESSARLKIEAAKQQLFALEQELQNKIEVSHKQ